MERVALDTNVLVAGLRSRHGASNRLLRLVGQEEFDVVLSVPLVLEYEDVLTRPNMVPQDRRTVERVLDVPCAEGVPHPIHFLWRPRLRDPKDDMVLELAVAAGCGVIVTHNLRDFAGVERFGIRAMPPDAFLSLIRPGPF